MTATTSGRELEPIGDASVSGETTTTVSNWGSPELTVVPDPVDFVKWVEGGARGSGMSGDLAKRAVDIVVSSIALAVTSPLWVAVGAVSALVEGGPILYRQERIGRYGTMFRCWKFRTMRTDADVVLHQLLVADSELARKWAEDYKLDDDPRVTPLGRFLRRFDLDEIPQFVNVLKGDMSVVGPRPIIRDEARKFGRHLPTVLSVRPGLTGLWQVSGRNSMTYDQRVLQEVEYVETRSFLGDLGICVRTPLTLLRRNGGR